jgi:hypothetical protein
MSFWLSKLCQLKNNLKSLSVEKSFKKLSVEESFETLAFDLRSLLASAGRILRLFLDFSCLGISSVLFFFYLASSWRKFKAPII